MKLAHHTHLSSSVVEAVKKGIPTIVLIRRPEEAVASAIVWDGLLRVNLALFSYIVFYEALWKYRRNFLAVDFEQAINRSGDCIQALNESSGSQFKIRLMDSREHNAILRQIEKSDQNIKRRATNQSLPTETKTSAKRDLIPKLASACLYPKAVEVYTKYKELISKTGLSIS